MMFWPSVENLLAIASRPSKNNGRQGAPTLEETIRETAQTHLAKQSKLDLGGDAVLLEDMRALASADREKVRKYEAKKLWGQSQSQSEADGDMGDIIICDDYHVQPTLRWPWAIVAAVGLVAAGLVASEYFRAPPPESQPIESSDTDTRYDLQFANEEPPNE